MHLKNTYILGRTISVWLTGFYCFWIAFIVSLSLAHNYVLEVGIVFLFFLIIGFSLLFWLLIIIKKQVEHLLPIWKKVLLISFIPFLYCWILKQYLQENNLGINVS